MPKYVAEFNVSYWMKIHVVARDEREAAEKADACVEARWRRKGRRWEPMDARLTDIYPAAAPRGEEVG